MKTEKALEALKHNMKSDSGLAWTWHSNIAMAIYDHEPFPGVVTANEIAADIMLKLVDVDVKKSTEWLVLPLKHSG